MAEKYIATIGRRKTASARVRLTPAQKENAISINNKPVGEYFKTDSQKKIALAPITVSGYAEPVTITAMVNGGGLHAQAEAVAHGIARALIEVNIDMRGDLKKAQMLKRDPRRKERKKFGLKAARKKGAWSKR